MRPRVEWAGRFQLAEEEKQAFQDILCTMFPDALRLVIEKEFVGNSFSGSWIFLLHLIRDQASQLPVVVKIASSSLIEKEWEAYQSCIAGKWPQVAQLKSELVLLTGGKFGGVSYSLVGEGVFAVQSLYRYFLDATLSDIEAVLKRLGKVLAEALKYSLTSPKFRLRATYDAILPLNLWVKCSSPSAGKEPLLITPTDRPKVSLDIGSDVCLQEFVVSKVDLKDQTITLNLPRPIKDLPQDSYCVRLKFENVQDMPAYQINQTISPTFGRVIETRSTQWQKEMATVLPSFQLHSQSVFLSDGTPLPNPFVAQQKILERHLDIKRFYIHGDFNLENILVDPEVKDIRLIDFAEAHLDHLLHDFLRLETEVITKLLPSALIEAGLPAQSIYTFYRQLHCVTFQLHPLKIGEPINKALSRPFVILKMVRDVARNHGLFNRDEYAEYYDCLTLYLLGALKFGNLNRTPDDPKPHPKELAFWGAATIQALLQTAPSCSENAKEPIMKYDTFYSPTTHATTQSKIDNRGGIYSNGKLRIGGDVVLGGSKNVYSGSFSGTFNAGSGNIYMGQQQQPAPEPPFEALLESLRREIKSQAEARLQSQALLFIDTLAQDIGEHRADLYQMEMMLGWYQKYIPSLIEKVVQLIFHSDVVKIIEMPSASDTTRSEYQSLKEKWQKS